MTKMKTIQVLIADDHEVVRRGLKQIISETPDIEVAGEAQSGRMVVKEITDNPSKYNVVLLDISMPDMNGLEVLKQIKALQPKMPVLILTMHSEKQYALRTLKAGASGYMTKASAPGELIEAIRKISTGRKHVSPSLGEHLAVTIDTTSTKDTHAALSDRELQVMLLIASGRTVTESAEAMALSVKTVSTYRSRVLDKMDLRNNTEIVQYAIRNNLL